MTSPARCPDCDAHPGRPCVEPGPDGVLYPLEGGLIHVRRMLAAVNLPASPLAALPSEARYLDCPACGERRRHDVVRIDGAVRCRSELDSRLGDALRASGINAADALAVQALYATAGQSGSHRIVSALRAVEAWLREDGAL